MTSPAWWTQEREKLARELREIADRATGMARALEAQHPDYVPEYLREGSTVPLSPRCATSA
jgi:hypothetical protein